MVARRACALLGLGRCQVRRHPALSANQRVLQEQPPARRQQGSRAAAAPARRGSGAALANDGTESCSHLSQTARGKSARARSGACSVAALLLLCSKEAMPAAASSSIPGLPPRARLAQTLRPARRGRQAPRVRARLRSGGRQAACLGHAPPPQCLLRTAVLRGADQASVRRYEKLPEVAHWRQGRHSGSYYVPGITGALGLGGGLANPLMPFRVMVARSLAQSFLVCRLSTR